MSILLQTAEHDSQQQRTWVHLRQTSLYRAVQALACSEVRKHEVASATSFSKTLVLCNISYFQRAAYHVLSLYSSSKLSSSAVFLKILTSEVFLKDSRKKWKFFSHIRKENIKKMYLQKATAANYIHCWYTLNKIQSIYTCTNPTCNCHPLPHMAPLSWVAQCQCFHPNVQAQSSTPRKVQLSYSEDSSRKVVF